MTSGDVSTTPAERASAAVSTAMATLAGLDTEGATGPFADFVVGAAAATAIPESAVRPVTGRHAPRSSAPGVEFTPAARVVITGTWLVPAEPASASVLDTAGSFAARGATETDDEGVAGDFAVRAERTGMGFPRSGFAGVNRAAACATGVTCAIDTASSATAAPAIARPVREDSRRRMDIIIGLPST